jgi:hypothetical protein
METNAVESPLPLVDPLPPPLLEVPPPPPQPATMMIPAANAKAHFFKIDTPQNVLKIQTNAVQLA